MKHGLLHRVGDWPYLTFHREVGCPVAPQDWAGEFADGGFGEPMRVR